MFTLKECRRIVADMKADGFDVLIFRTPENAPCNQYPANIFNTGRYMTCPADERPEYEAGGAQFVDGTGRAI